MTGNMLNVLLENKRGYLSVLGAFLINLCVGCFPCTFGNILPYLSSYMRQLEPDLSHGDLSAIYTVGGASQGFSYLIGGLIIIPLLGNRVSLVLGCLLLIISPLLTYFLLETSVALLSLSYGLLNGISINLILLVTTVMPVTWFPEHSGKVIGFVMSGFGLAQTVFSPLESFIVNPDNIPPVSPNTTNATEDISQATYFTDPEVLGNVPGLMLWMAAINTVLLVVGLVLLVEKEDRQSKKEEVGLKQRLRDSLSYLYQETCTSKDFYFLWLTRFLHLLVGSAILANWKTFSLTLSDDDKTVSLVGGLCGFSNCLSRLIGGFLIDHIQYRVMMPVISLLLTIILVIIYFVGQQSFIACMMLVWLLNLLCFAHFSTIPVQALSLFPGKHGHVVLGAIGLSESFSFAAFGVMNSVIFSDERRNTFLILFLTLSVCSLISVPVTAAVSSTKNSADRKERVQGK